MKSRLILMALVLCLLVPVAAGAHTPKGGLGDVAVSPDGKLLVAGGDSRVLYIMDPKSLAVTKRVYLGTNIYEMEFNQDGSVLVVEDIKDNLMFIKTSDWKVFKEVAKAANMSAAPAADLVAGADASYKGSTVKVISMKDGSIKGSVQFPGPAQLIGMDAAGKKLVVLGKAPGDKEPRNKTPKDLKGLDKELFAQKNDGYMAIICEYELPACKQTRQDTIWYYPRFPATILVTPQETLILAYNNVNAKLVGKEITLFQAASSYNYGAGVSPDRKAFLCGGLRTGSRGVTAGLAITKFEASNTPGWPEYYKGFGFGPDGMGYGVTTSFRLVVIDPSGKVVKQVPVY